VTLFRSKQAGWYKRHYLLTNNLSGAFERSIQRQLQIYSKSRFPRFSNKFIAELGYQMKTVLSRARCDADDGKPLTTRFSFDFMSTAINSFGKQEGENFATTTTPDKAVDWLSLTA